MTKQTRLFESNIRSVTILSNLHLISNYDPTMAHSTGSDFIGTHTRTMMVSNINGKGVAKLDKVISKQISNHNVNSN